MGQYGRQMRVNWVPGWASGMDSIFPRVSNRSALSGAVSRGGTKQHIKKKKNRGNPFF
jgi:hypothetical protein